MTVETRAETTLDEPEDYTELEAELTAIARATIWDAWKTRAAALGKLNRWQNYADGDAGIPEVDADASLELRELAKNSPINMCGVVVDTFDSGMSVAGFRSPDAQDNEAAWELWQANQMDARQSEVHRSALTYGIAFVSVLPDDTRDGAPSFATWTPKNAIAEFDDPRRDLFPRRATLLRPVVDDKRGAGWSVLLVDEFTVQPGFIRDRKRKAKGAVGGVDRDDIVLTGEAWPHGATYDGRPVCPVVPFPNERTAEDRPPRGEVEPLIRPQRALNVASYDRMVVARFGAFRQRAVIGWTASKQELAKAAASAVWAFDDHPDDVRLQDFAPSPLTPYDGLITAMREQIALQAAIPIYNATGNLSNVSTDTVAMVENAYQRKLARKKDSSGEAWEQVLRIAVTMAGGEQPSDAAEVIWRDTTPRTFGAVVDGITKLASVPAESGDVMIEMLDLVPGVTQQKRDALADVVRRNRSRNLLAAVQAATRPNLSEAGAEGAAEQSAETQADRATTLKAQFDALGIAVRAGVDADDAASRVGLEGLKFTGAVPVALRMPETDASSLEER